MDYLFEWYGSMPADGTDFVSLYKHADKALFKAKRQGKDQNRIYIEENL